MESKPVEFIIHIGQHKTGSTAIQDFLYRNQQILFDEASTLYPDFMTEGYLTNRRFIHESSLYHLYQLRDTEKSLQVLGDCVEFCMAKSIRRIIISSESLCRRVWWPPVFHTLQTRFNLVTRIFVYLRRQDYWAESAWKQEGCHNPKYNSIEEYLFKADMDWYKMLLPWIELFPREQFILRPFEKEIIGNDVVSDFLNNTGLSDFFAEARNKPLGSFINPGYSNEVLEMMNLCKVTNIVSEKNDIPFNPLQDLIRLNLSEKFKRNDPFKSYGLLSPSLRVEILKKYAESNTKLSYYFFPEGDGRFFKDILPHPDEPWEAPEPLTIQNVIPVFMDLLISLDIQSRKNKDDIKDLRHTLFERIKQQSKKTDKVSDSLNSLLQKAINSLEGSILGLIQKSVRPLWNTYFCQSIDELFLIENVDMRSFINGIKYKSDLSDIKESLDGIQLNSIGKDPYLIVNLPEGPKGLIVFKIEITTPEVTEFQLFYRSRIGKPFRESASIRKRLDKGRNVFYLRIPITKIDRKIRIDPGTHPGLYVIHSLGIAR